ncbi:MAG: hypothetical protein NUV47_01010 [Patescibacteria group bacterium]|nr:hypothetical protein [Patescibacteria group bacterium]
MNESRKLPIVFILIAIFGLYGFFLAHPISLVTADLGRHIENGAVLFQNSSVLSTNFYSYINPDFHIINHHWGSGLLFFVMWKLFGFVGLHLFFILISFLAFAVFLLHGKSYAGWGIVGFVSLIVIPLLAERTEIRPEMISYLFAGLFFFLLSRRLFLWFLPIIGIIWVNTHIYFLLGLLIIGAFLLESLLVKRSQFFTLLKVFIATLLAMLINPFGIKAFTEAVTIFNNYGYRLAENQSVWFMEKIMADPNFLIFKILFTILVLSFVIALWRNWRAVRLSHFFIACGLSIMAWLAIRNLALFGLFFIPLVCSNIAIILPNLRENEIFLRISAMLAGFSLLVSVLFTIPQYFPYWYSFGLGLEKGNDAPAVFLKEQNIKGPIFNNYDIGGYLIFYLYPNEKVFVDNRPEAYPVSFFQDVYIPMQENEEIWNKELAQYKFNSIIFSYHDATPWAQAFLLARIKDPEWAPVFVDGRVLIFLRRTLENEATIKKFELPKNLFIHA